MADKKPKLYELVSAREDRKKSASASLTETTAHFKQKGSDLFLGHVKITTALSEDRKLELDAREEKVCPSAVIRKLEYTFDLVAKDIDVSASVDASNRTAVGDIIVGNKVIAKDVPVPTLLALEKRIRSEVLPMIEGAPTLTTGTAWELDSSKGGNIFKTVNEISRNKEEKGWEVLTLAPATDKFPAQVSKEVKVVVVAVTKETQWSGMIPSQEKADMISRVHELLIAIVAARNRANDVEATELQIGKNITNHILGR